MTLALMLVLSAAPAMNLEVDLREAPRRLVHARMTLPAAPGTATFLYPKWIPGEHGPNGPVADVAGVTFTAGGRALSWWRDELDVYAFHVEVPAAVDQVEATLEYLAPPPGTRGYSAGACCTSNLAVLSWNTVVLYPLGLSPRDLTVTASAMLPAGWKWGSALAAASEAGGRVAFEPASLERLVDSPVLAGRHLREFPLGSGGGAAHTLVAAAESEAALELPPALAEKYQRLVAEAQALFGARHYGAYRFLLALSDGLGYVGLEHHESSDNRFRERALVDPELHLAMADLLPHEFAHSWNGKHRRPSGLATRDFQEPMRGKLLWVYEGLTEYLGLVLAARSGLVEQEDFRDAVAAFGEAMRLRRGRTWRPLEDTAVAAHVLYGSRSDWTGRRRSVDFYVEGLLVWLDADTLIRERSGGRRSLDDFVRAFFGGVSGAPGVKPYQIEDVLAALREVQPLDWKGFFEARVAASAPEPPLDGLARGGWRLAYREKPARVVKAWAAAQKAIWLQTSLGLSLKAEDGAIIDVVPESPADKAGLAPAAKLVGVNGRRFTPEALSAALETSRATGKVELLVEDAEFFRTLVLDYDGGPRHPVLRREQGKPDLLSAIAAPRAPRGQAWR